MKVTAIKPAFHNGARVRVGAELEVSDDFKASWFVKAETVEAAKVAKEAKPSRPQPKALSQMGKGEDKSFIQAHSEKADLA
jgi:hypothetical protein